MSIAVLGTPGSGFKVGCNCIGTPPCKTNSGKSEMTFKEKSSYMTHNQKFHRELVFDPLYDLDLPKGYSISADDDNINLWHITRHTEENSVENYGNFKMASLTEVVGELGYKKCEEEDEDSELTPDEKPKKKTVTKKPKKAVVKKDSESEPEPVKPANEDVKEV